MTKPADGKHEEPPLVLGAGAVGELPTAATPGNEWVLELVLDLLL
jgi:hypothetical protein